MHVRSLLESDVIIHVRTPKAAVDYPVCFTCDVFSPVNLDLRRLITRREPDARKRIAAIVDRGVVAAQPEINLHIERYARCHHDALDLIAPPIVQGGGESVKDDAALPPRLQAYIHALELDRRSILLAIGGASLLDLVGFAVSTVKSAPRIIRVPTTTLAQAGPAILPQNAINAFGTRDFLGTFHPPFAVVCDRRFIDAQKTRDRVFGIVHAIRAALLWDSTLFDWIVERAGRLAAGERDAVVELSKRSTILHIDRTASELDEDLTSPESPLAFGTWAADQIEARTDRRIRHGAALAIGIALDVTLGASHKTNSETERETILRLLERLGLRLWHDSLGHLDPDGRLLLLDGLSDRAFGHVPAIPLLQGIGQGIRLQMLREKSLHDAIDYLRARDTHRAHAFAFA